jgi:hypothetical protein
MTQKVTYQPYLDLHQSSGRAYNFCAEQIEQRRRSQFASIRELLALNEKQLVPVLMIYEIVPKQSQFALSSTTTAVADQLLLAIEPGHNEISK